MFNIIMITDMVWLVSYIEGHEMLIIVPNS